ncbi:multidrug resistance protein [Gossypium australe]|uniref:Multidrug resistance protein n=1 Tax=Gossypium australe TaxID=47621 RepID=A0A5B6V8A3_9ROSI|nr:multidrug resistance protein [Gossypium australe]
MNEFGTGRSVPWNMYPSSDTTPSQPVVDKETPLKNLGTSMNAISFGFVATAILISMFVIMAIFEHLFQPNPAFSSPNQDGAVGSGAAEKLGNPQRVSTSYATDLSVVMPGEQHPTYIAQLAPLPCPREGIYWPPHEHNFVYP